MSSIHDHFVFKVGRPRNLQTLIIDNYFGVPYAEDSFLDYSDNLRIKRHFPSALVSPDTSIDLTEERKQLVPAVSPRNYGRELDSKSEQNDSFNLEQQGITIFKETQSIGIS